MPPKNSATAQDPQEFDENYDPEVGRVLFVWEFDEHQNGHRSKRWYVIMALLSALLLLYAVWTENFTFALILLMLAVVYFLLEWKTPDKVTFAITDVGISVGNRFHRYSDLDSFWIIYYPPAIKNLYFRFPESYGPRYRVPLEDADPLAVRETLLAFVREDLDQEDIPVSESIGRLFKL